MSKQVTISSLVRQAARNENDFVETLTAVFSEESFDRIAEFFDRLNIPRACENETADLTAGLPTFPESVTRTGNFVEEQLVGNGIQKFLDRHLKKLKWHAQHPSLEGGRNALLLMRQAMMITEIRLVRLQKVLRSQDALTPDEWAIARELMNRAFLSFRHYLQQFGGAWIDALAGTAERHELEELLGRFFEQIDGTIRKLEEHRLRIEERRLELTVLPKGYDPVKPPVYFGGDLMGKGPWKQFWIGIEESSHHFREAAH